MKPRFNNKILRKGGPHQKTRKAQRKKDKQRLAKGLCSN